MQIVVDGILTHYEVIGENKKEKLLILHGWKRSLAEWLPTAKALSEKYQVILLDLPGFGQTAMPKSAFSIYEYASFVEHFLDKLEVKEITLLGHSFGGRIGIILGATQHPAQGKIKLKKLVFVDAAGIEKRNALEKTQLMLVKALKAFVPFFLREKLRQSLGSDDYKTSGALRTIFLKVINEDLTYLLSQIHVPALIVWGYKDTEIPEWKTKLMKNKIPRATLRVVWETGHDSHLEKPREFMEILKENI